MSLGSKPLFSMSSNPNNLTKVPRIYHIVILEYRPVPRLIRHDVHVLNVFGIKLFATRAALGVRSTIWKRMNHVLSARAPCIIFDLGMIG